MPGTVGSPNVRHRSTISHLSRQSSRLTFSPISPDPPSGRKISSSPGTMICKLLAGGIAPMDQRQPLDCEIAIDMIEDGGVLFEQKREASGGDDLGGPPHFRADAADQPFDQADIAPIDAAVHRVHRGAADHRL